MRTVTVRTRHDTRRRHLLRRDVGIGDLRRRHTPIGDLRRRRSAIGKLRRRYGTVGKFRGRDVGIGDLRRRHRTIDELRCRYGAIGKFHGRHSAVCNLRRRYRSIGKLRCRHVTIGDTLRDDRVVADIGIGIGSGEVAAGRTTGLYAGDGRRGDCRDTTGTVDGHDGCFRIQTVCSRHCAGRRHLLRRHRTVGKNTVHDGNVLDLLRRHRAIGKFGSRHRAILEHDRRHRPIGKFGSRHRAIPDLHRRGRTVTNGGVRIGTVEVATSGATRHRRADRTIHGRRHTTGGIDVHADSLRFRSIRSRSYARRRELVRRDGVIGDTVRRDRIVGEFHGRDTSVGKVRCRHRFIGQLRRRHRAVLKLPCRHGTIDELRRRHGAIGEFRSRDTSIDELRRRHRTIGKFHGRHGAVGKLPCRHRTIDELRSRHGAVGEFLCRHRSVDELRRRHRTIGKMGGSDPAVAYFDGYLWTGRIRDVDGGARTGDGDETIGAARYHDGVAAGRYRRAAFADDDEVSVTAIHRTNDACRHRADDAYAIGDIRMQCRRNGYQRQARLHLGTAVHGDGHPHRTVEDRADRRLRAEHDVEHTGESPHGMGLGPQRRTARGGIVETERHGVIAFGHRPAPRIRDQSLIVEDTWARRRLCEHSRHGHQSTPCGDENQSLKLLHNVVTG